MRLLVDARTGWGHGIGRFVANTVPRVERSRPQWRIDVLVREKDRDAAVAAFMGCDNLTIRACPIVPFSLREQLGLERWAGGYDLTWFTNYWVPLGWRGRYVVTVHDLLHLEPHLFPAALPKRLLARATFAKLRRSAAAIMFVSRFTQRTFETRIGVPKYGVTVHLGADHVQTPPSFVRERRMLVVAASKQHKNFAIVLAAWRKAQLHSGWTLTIVTQDSALRSAISLETEVGTGAGIEVLRGISDNALDALFARSSVLLMPSRYEGFGLPLIEGLRAGLLCISSTAPALVEIAEGCFVQFADPDDCVGWAGAMNAAAEMIDAGAPDLRPLLAHNAERAARFRWDRTAHAVADVIDAAVSASP